MKIATPLLLAASLASFASANPLPLEHQLERGNSPSSTYMATIKAFLADLQAGKPVDWKKLSSQIAAWQAQAVDNNRVINKSSSTTTTTASGATGAGADAAAQNKTPATSPTTTKSPTTTQSPTTKPTTQQTTTPTTKPPTTTPATKPSTTTSTSSTAAPANAAVAAGTQDTANKDQFVSLHNTFRAQYGASQVTWNDTLAVYAYNAASTCKYGHTYGPYGENIAAGVGGGYNVQAGFNSWSNEYKLYNWSKPGYSEATGHFTQIVWKATSQIGCAAVSCPDGSIFTGYKQNSLYLVCEYQQPGNWVDPNNASNTAKYFTQNVGTYQG